MRISKLFGHQQGLKKDRSASLNARARKRAAQIGRAKPLRPETRSKPAHDDFWYAPVGSLEPTTAGVAIDEKTALKYLTVFACVTLIAGDVARLPLNMYQRKAGGGKARVIEHDLYDIVHTSPNNEMTSFQWREAAVGHDLLWGNTYATVGRSTNGNVIDMWPVDNPGAVEMGRDGHGLFYKWKTMNAGEVMRRREDMLHIPGFGFNGLQGMSMIALAREAIGMGMAAEQFGGRYFGNGTHPSGHISLPVDAANMDIEDQKKYINLLREQNAGLGKSHNLLVTFNGETYKPMTVPMDDAQFLETRDHQKVEICGMYHVPPHKIALHGANSNHNNLEQENQSYVDSCLMHWLVRWEQCLNQQLLSRADRKKGLFFEFLVDGLLRGDSQARAEYYNKMLAAGSMSPNEIRGKENLNPIDGGDIHVLPLNMISIDQAGNPMAPEKKSIEHRATPAAESRSLIARDRITRNFYQLFQDAAQQVVSRETKAVKNQIQRVTSQRAEADTPEWLQDFYETMPAYIRTKLGPVMRSFALAVADETMGEIDQVIDAAELETFVEEFVDGYAVRHVSSSQGQIEALLDEPEAVATRMDEWQETRAEKIATNETVRMGSAVFQAVAFAAGLRTVWRIRGAETCPYCTSLNGKAVARGESFVNDGDNIKVEEGGKWATMKIRGTKAHPPLHQGCDCYLSAF